MFQTIDVLIASRWLAMLRAAPSIAGFGLCASLLITSTKAMAALVAIAIVETVPVQGGAPDPVSALFRAELTALFEGEHDLAFVTYGVKTGSDDAAIQKVVDAAYANPDIDHVLVLDFAANQIVGRRARFPKPTFLPLVLNGALLGYPQAGGGSGVTNLSYVTGGFDLTREIEDFQQVARFSHAALVVDRNLQRNIDHALQSGLVRQAGDSGVRLSIVPYGDDPSALLALLPESVDAVFYGHFPSLDEGQMRRL